MPGELVQPSNLVLALIVVTALILVGIIVLNFGGAVMSNRGSLGVGGYGVVRVGVPRTEGLLRIQNSNHPEGLCARMNEGLVVAPMSRRPFPSTGAYRSAGLWDSGQGQMGIMGANLTTASHSEQEIFGIDNTGSFKSL